MIYLVFICISDVSCQITGKPILGVAPVIKTDKGFVGGYIYETTSGNREYRVYNGIPYAKPPVGKLRFEPPQPAEKWNTIIKNATNEKYCVYKDLNDDIVGLEDCLYLNVYVPQNRRKDSKLLPVIFWIHGGRLTWGTGEYAEYGPDLFLDEGIIFVSPNHRMGPFGYLSTGDVVVPGNMGLKDQLAALQWVQRNIDKFGGDPEKVTIAGEDSGAASVAYLIQSDLARGLFKSAVLQSGVSLAVWALTIVPKEITKSLARTLGITTTSSQRLRDRLREVPYKKLQEAFLSLEPWNDFPEFPFVIEPNHSGAVIKYKSYESLKNGDFQKCPVLLGFNSQEGGSNIYTNYVNALRGKGYGNVNPYLVPWSMRARINDSDSNQIGDKVKKYFFGSSGLKDEELYHFVGDNLFVRPILRYTRFLANQTQTYLYKFSYTGKLAEWMRFSNARGVAHFEDIYYLFNVKGIPEEISKNDTTTRKRLVRLWSNFVKYGNPTPQNSDSLIQNVKWLQAFEKNSLRYLDIGKDLRMGTNPNKRDEEFWAKLFEKEGREPYGLY